MLLNCYAMEFGIYVSFFKHLLDKAACKRSRRKYKSTRMLCIQLIKQLEFRPTEILTK